MESLQREAYNQALNRLNPKTPPSLDRIFNYSITQKIVDELQPKAGSLAATRRAIARFPQLLESLQVSAHMDNQFI